MTDNTRKVVVNSPYREPERYFLYHEQDNTREAGFSIESGRRPAGVWIESSRGSAREFVELELVNKIRRKVKEWRGDDYPEVTSITRELLYHWHDRTMRPDTPFFFCQLEAIETLIFLRETREGRKIIIPGDGGQFTRLCTKLCTGGGKTVVMSMLIAWQTCSTAGCSESGRYTKNFLIVAPNLTVKDRLEVLNPRKKNNYYDSFCVVPDGMRRMLNQAEVVVTNWQAMQEKKIDDKCVVKLPAKKAESFCRDIAGGMRDILVINDEAHHAYRVRPEDKKSGRSADEKADIEAATVWMRGLDVLNEVRGINMCCDFSATPFVPGRGRNDAEGLFSWIVSDYSLDDGIEAGIVKTPMIPVYDNAPSDPETGRSKLYHIYKYVKDDLNRKKAEENESLPDLVRQAYELLGHDWQEEFTRWSEAGNPVPPVMISVANTTSTAARIEYAFKSGSLSNVPALCEGEYILRIDSEILRKASDSEKEILRDKAATVGQEDKSGGQLRNIISVGMLSEGWDARTVTHIMGLRAFTSQLLCEQIVGRGLRRRSYEPVGENELFSPEYVTVFGIPFAYLLTEEHRAEENITRRPTREVRVLDERKEFAITWPEVDGIEYIMRQRLSLNVEDIPVLTLNAHDMRVSAELSPVQDGKPNLTLVNDIDLDSYYAHHRMQNIIFTAASRVYDEMKSCTQWQYDANKLQLIGQIVKLAEEYIHSGKIKIAPELFETDTRRRKLLLCLNMDRVIRSMWNGIRSSSSEEVIPVFPQGKRERSTGEMHTWRTSREHVYQTRKSHINFCVTDSEWESSAAYQLDRNENVRAWAKNDHLGFAVKYSYGGVTRKYLPDFLVKLTNDKTLILEVKGIESEQDKTKREALCEWVRAVNTIKTYGEWVCDVAYSPSEIDGIIALHAQK